MASAISHAVSVRPAQTVVGPTRAAKSQSLAAVAKGSAVVAAKHASFSRSTVSAQALSRAAAPRAAARTTGSVQAAASVTQADMATKLADEDKQAFIDAVDTFIFDCDGVIWKGDAIIPGVPETLDMLKEAGKRLIFVTNNSTKSRAGYLKKFHGLGLTQVEAEMIFSSSFAAAAYLEYTKFKESGKKVYIVGEVGIQEELDLVGVPYIGGTEDVDKKIELTSGFFLDHDKDVGAVIVGFDRYFNYYKIQYATLCLRENPGCEFIATNTDAVTHLTDAQEWAGNGSMVGCIKGSSQMEPTVVGKPEPFMLDYIKDKFSLRSDQICMVGDRLDTDILFGKDGGLRTLLVLSGVTTEERLQSPENKIQPDFYTAALPELLSVKK
jgi:phosphoglycolate/pyridoxal phosphate phosphatase family enzyme